MFVTKLAAVLNASADGTPPTSVGFSGKHALHPLEQIQANHRDGAEREQRQRVHVPRLLAARVDTRHAIERPLDRQEEAVAGRGAAAEHARQIRAEQRRRHQQRTDQRDKLQPVRGRSLPPTQPSRSGASSA